MSGEIDGVRKAMERMGENMRKEGRSQEYIKRKTREIAERADRNIRSGQQPKPKIRD